MSASLVSSEIEHTPDVRQLAEKLGVTASLPSVLQMTREVFPEADIEVEAYQDHELADEWWIVLSVRHAIDDPMEAVAVESNWHRRLFDCCPPQLASAFSIATSFRP